MNNININRAISSGLGMSAVKYSFSPESSREALMDGAYLGLACIGTDLLGDSNPIYNLNSVVSTSVPLSDATIYSLINLGMYRSERNAKDFFYNFLLSYGSSAIIGNLFEPLGSTIGSIGNIGGGATASTPTGTASASVPSARLSIRATHV